jgi:hypothetical protein
MDLGNCPFPRASIQIFGSPEFIFSETQKTGGANVLYSDWQFTQSLDCNSWEQKKGRSQVKSGFFWVVIPINFQIGCF